MNLKKKERVFDKNIVPEYERVFNFIYSRLDHNRELAQDVTQDVMELAWDRLHQLHKAAAPRAWLMQIAMNEIKKYFRSQNTQKRGAYQEESCDLLELGNMEDIDRVEADVLDLIVAKEERELLMTALNRVDEKYRVLVDLRLIHDLRFAEIAEIVQIKEAVARVYFRRGITLLGKEYDLLTGGGKINGN